MIDTLLQFKMSCDSCPVKCGFLSSSKALAIALASSVGWEHGEDTDYCPECLAKLSGKESSTNSERTMQ